MKKLGKRIMKIEKFELIVVFKKDITIEDAAMKLDEFYIQHRQGMDSSRGKAYFYETGPKFIVTFDTHNEKETFIANCQQLPGIYEIYIPNWDINKD